MARLLHRRPRGGNASRIAAAVVVVYAMLLPAYGPMLSPSFAELLPNHTHVHLSGHPSPHLHSYDLLGASGATDGDGGMLALPSTGDGSAAGIAVPVTLAALLTAASAAALVLLTAPPAAPLRGRAPRAETPPPRTLSLPA